ncbi:flippase-like domain-containing protein [bacterium]|nr:flippase-like domain-containing protein [bacterium]
MMKFLTKKQILLTAITLGVFVFLFRNVSFLEMRNVISQANGMYLFAAFLVMFTFPLLCAIRWQMIVVQIGADLSVWESFKIIMAAWPIGAVTPAKSGDLIKLLFLKNVLPYSKTTGVILAERLMDVLALCTFSIVLGIQYGFYKASLFSGAMLVGVAGLVFLLETPLIRLVPARWTWLMENVFEATKYMFRNGRNFFSLLCISLLNWFMTFMQTWLCYQAFGYAVPLAYIMAALPIAIFIGLIPVTLSGMGTRDWAIIELFGQFAPKEANLAVGILYSIFGYWILTVLGLFFLKSALSGSIGGVKGEELRETIYDKAGEKDLSQVDFQDSNEKQE